MISERYHRIIKIQIKKIQRYTNRIWFSPLLLVLAFLDALVIIIPTDGILISSSMITKKRWSLFGTSVAIGSALGAFLLSYLAGHFGIEKILEYYPGIDQSSLWKSTFIFFQQYGLLVVFIVGITPFTQQPALIIAGLSKLNLTTLFLAILISRIIKFNIMAFIASHTPKLINKMWGIQGEIKDAGIKISN